MVEVWCTKGGFAEAIDERSEWFIGFLSDAQEGYDGGLMGTAAGKVGGKHVGEDVETID